MANVPVMFQCPSWSEILKKSQLSSGIAVWTAAPAEFFKDDEWGVFSSRNQEKKKLESSHFFRSSLTNWLLLLLHTSFLSMSTQQAILCWAADGCMWHDGDTGKSVCCHLFLALISKQGSKRNATLLLLHDQVPALHDQVPAPEKLQKAEQLKTELEEISESTPERSHQLYQCDHCSEYEAQEVFFFFPGPLICVISDLSLVTILLIVSANFDAQLHASNLREKGKLFLRVVQWLKKKHLFDFKHFSEPCGKVKKVLSCSFSLPREAKGKKCRVQYEIPDSSMQAMYWQWCNQLFSEPQLWKICLSKRWRRTWVMHNQDVIIII